MAVVPFVLAHRHAVAVLLQEMLVGGVAMRALPAAEFHEIAAELLLALVEGRAADVAAGRIGLARMDGRIVDLLRRLAAAPLDEFFLHLVRIEARIVDLRVVDLGAAVRHPVGDELAEARTVLDPDGDGVPQPPHLLAFADRRAAVGRHLQQTVEGAPLVVAELAEDRRQLDRALQRLEYLLHVEVALRGRKPRLMLFENVARMAEARVLLLVVAPFDHAAFGRGRDRRCRAYRPSCPGRAAADSRSPCRCRRTLCTARRR